MKTVNNLYPQLCTFGNLVDAWHKTRRGKRAKPIAAEFEQNLGEELCKLQDELQAETWHPSGYRHFTIHEPKRRKISAAPLRDRVVHHALCNIIEPIYERKFIFDSYANRKGKGTHRALDRCTQFMRRYPYVLQCDVQQFFPSIDHEILLGILGKAIRDKQVLRLCDKIMTSGRGVLADEYTMRYFPGDSPSAVSRPRGLPIGNLTSQFWANVYLNELDQFVKHQLRCKGYVRYVDDFLLFSDNKTELREWKSATIDYLQTLRLGLHENRLHPRPTSTGLPFLGFIVYPEYRRLKNKTGHAYRRHLSTLYKQYKAGIIGRDQLDASVRAWVGHAMHGDTWGLRTHLLGQLQL